MGEGILKRIQRWRLERYWTPRRQLELLRIVVSEDHRWLANDKTADALTSRYLDLLAADWYKRPILPAGAFRRSIDLDPHIGK